MTAKKNDDKDHQSDEYLIFIGSRIQTIGSVISLIGQTIEESQEM